MEENRFFCNETRILYFFQILSSFCSIHNVPSALCVNFDEEGNNTFSDATKTKILVPNGSPQKTYPVPRNGGRTTLMGSIYSDGTYNVISLISVYEV